MWKQLKISEQIYFIWCGFNENTQDITFLLYDFKITWCQTINFKDVKIKVKLMNKRFDFNENNIKEALTSDAIQSAVLEEGTSLESCALKLKYRVKNCLLSYEWCLRKQNLLEFQQTLVQPLLLTLLECQQQIEILAESVRKKDLELKQFRIEGAVLNRKTLVTKPFDFDDFNAKFYNCDKTTTNIKDLAKYVKEAQSAAGPEVTNNKNLTEERSETNVKNEENIAEDKRPNIKMSPRQKKRKANEIKMGHLQQHLKLRRLGLEYESSQSQTLSSGSSQSTEESGTKNSKPTTAKEREKSKVENQLSPRKSTRCSTLKQKQLIASADDKTDSEYEDQSRTSGQKIYKKAANNRKTNSSANSSNLETNANSKDVPPKETKHIKHNSPSSSKNNRKKSSVECISSNVFDFSTESDDDTPLIKRKNMQNKTEQSCQKLNPNKPTNNTSVIFNKSPVFDSDIVNSIKSPSPNNNLSHSSTPVIINEISSQLDMIKKELETLEAMRLADLEQRLCKI